MVEPPAPDVSLDPDLASPAPGRALLAGDGVEVLVLFEKIRDVEERVPLQAEIDKGRLHAGKHARDASFMDASGERILVGPLEINFDELIVLDQRHSGLVPIGRDHQFLTHSALLPRAICARNPASQRLGGRIRKAIRAMWLAVPPGVELPQTPQGSRLQPASARNQLGKGPF